MLLTIALENHRLILLDDRKALVKDLRSILFAHELSEFGEFTRGDVDHFVLAHVACDARILSFVVDRVALGASRLGSGQCLVNTAILRQALQVLQVTIV